MLSAVHLRPESGERTSRVQCLWRQADQHTTRMNSKELSCPTKYICVRTAAFGRAVPLSSFAKTHATPRLYLAIKPTPLSTSIFVNLLEIIRETCWTPDCAHQCSTREHRPLLLPERGGQAWSSLNEDETSNIRECDI